MIGRLVLHAITRLANRAGFHGMDDSTHAAILAAIEHDSARLTSPELRSMAVFPIENVKAHRP